MPLLHSTPNLPFAGDSSIGRRAPEGYSLWEFNGNEWKLRKDASSPGAQPSQPPRLPGTFVGQIRSTPSIAASA